MENSCLPSASQWFFIPRNVHSVKRQVLSSISTCHTAQKLAQHNLCGMFVLA